MYRTVSVVTMAAALCILAARASALESYCEDAGAGETACTIDAGDPTVTFFELHHYATANTTHATTQLRWQIAGYAPQECWIDSSRYNQATGAVEDNRLNQHLQGLFAEQRPFVRIYFDFANSFPGSQPYWRCVGLDLGSGSIVTAAAPQPGPPAVVAKQLDTLHVRLTHSDPAKSNMNCTWVWWSNAWPNAMRRSSGDLLARVHPDATITVHQRDANSGVCQDVEVDRVITN